MKKIIVIVIMMLILPNKYFSINVADSNKSTIAKRLADTTMIEIVKQPKNSFWDRNEGTLIGSLLAGLIALFTVLFTNYISKKIIKRNQLEKYYGLLFALKKELDYHKNVLPNLILELDKLLIISKELKILLIDKLSRDIPISFMKEIRSSILLVDNYNTTVFQFLLDYITNCELINSDIQFEKINKTKEKFAEELFIDAVDTYFKKLTEGIELLYHCIDPMNILIEDEIREIGFGKRITVK